MNNCIIKTISFSIICLLAFCGMAQTTGYLGQRFFVSVSESVLPDIRRIGSDYYNEPFKIPLVNVRFPLAADVNYVVSNSVSIGAGVTSTNVVGNFRNMYYFINDNNNRLFYYSAVTYNAKLFNLYLEGHKRLSYSVIDNYFRFGIGFASFKNTSYHDSYCQVGDNYYGSSALYKIELPSDVEVFRLDQKSSLTGLYYEFGNRIPVANHILLFYGISGYLFPVKDAQYTSFDDTQISNTTSNTCIIDLGKKRVGNGNMLKFNFGLTFTL